MCSSDAYGLGPGPRMASKSTWIACHTQLVMSHAGYSLLGGAVGGGCSG